MQAGLSLAMLEAGLRGAAVALVVVLAALLLRDGRRTAAGLYGALFAVSVAAYIIVTAPGLLFSRPLPWLVPLRLVSLGTPAMFWLFAWAAFDDAAKASWRHVVPWLGTVAIGFVCARGLLPPACLLYHALQLAFVALAIRQALLGRSADLVEERRRFRVALVLSAAIYTLAVIALETIMGGPPAAPPLSTVNAAGVLGLTFVFVLTQLSLSTRGQLIPATAVPRGLPVDPSLRVDTAPSDDQETPLLERLRRLMEEERVYREEGLSVGTLAHKLSLPEYRLRRLINGRLGHRNFSTFVNAYRLADAMAALGDPGQAAVPVVTIALDAGFQSLGPFNRAFKAHTGVTPTDYRRQQLARGEKPARA